jgi:hypothetical protein
MESYIISKSIKERDSVVVSEMASEYEGSGFESFWFFYFYFRYFT